MAKRTDRPDWARKGTKIQCKESGKKIWGEDARGVVSSVKGQRVFARGDIKFRDGRIKERFSIDLAKGEGAYWEVDPHTLPKPVFEIPSWLQVMAKVRVRGNTPIPVGAISEGMVSEVLEDRFKVRGTEWRGGRTPRSDVYVTVALGPPGTVLDWELAPIPPKIIGLPDWVRYPGVRIRPNPKLVLMAQKGIVQCDEWRVSQVLGNAVDVVGTRQGEDPITIRLNLKELQEWSPCPPMLVKDNTLTVAEPPKEGVPFLVQDSSGSFRWASIDERAIYLVREDKDTGKVHSVSRVEAGSTAMQLMSVQSSLATRQHVIRMLTGAEVRNLVLNLLMATSA